MKRLRELPDLSKASAAFRRLNPHLEGGILNPTNLIDKHSQKEIGDCDPTKEKKIRREKKIKLNGTETRMLNWLQARERKGEISEVRIMPLSLKWGVDNEGHYSTYSPDFSYRHINGRMVLIEVKGGLIFSRDLSRFRGCRADWCGEFHFQLWKWSDREWTRIL